MKGVKSVSTRAPGSRATCHLTDFSETLPVWRVYPKTQKKKQTGFCFGFFQGGDRPTPPPVFLGFHGGNRFKVEKMYEALIAMVFNQLLWGFVHIFLHP